MQGRRQLITTIDLPILHILPLKPEAIRDEQNYFQSLPKKSVSFAEVLLHIFSLVDNDLGVRDVFLKLKPAFFD